MPAVFTVQDDEGDVASANAYISTAYFYQYHLDRGRTTAAALSEAQVKIGIVRATDYIDMRWRDQFAGEKIDFDEDIPQTTEWPRQNVAYDSGVDIEGLPVELKKAVAEYALRAATMELLLDASRGVAADGTPLPTGEVTETEVKVGPVSERLKYASTDGGFGSGTLLVDGLLIPKIPAADMLMEPLLKHSSRQRRAIR